MPRPLLAAAALTCVAAPAFAQPPRLALPPLADTPAGVVAARGALLDPARRGFQTVAVSVNGGGAVEVFAGGPGAASPVPVAANGDTMFQLCVGRTYRLRVTDAPQLDPGTVLFPSVELVDRLHPPLGLAGAFPLPISVTRREAELAAEGVLVTKVIYLEDPLIAPVSDFVGPLRRTDLAPSADALTEADARGRVIAIVRLGGRTPDGGSIEPAFYGTGGPVLEAPVAEPNLPAVPPVSPPLNVTPASHSAGVVGCPLGGGCPAGACPTGACPADGCPVERPSPPGGTAGVPVAPYNRGFVLDDMPPAALCPPEVYPRDEYLCDGGDRLRPAGTTLGGVDAEDAVVRYRCSDGEVQVLPTNRVCIYAPRFAEVRTFFGVVNDTRYRGPRDVMRTAAATAAAIDIPTGFARQDVRPDAARARSRVSGLIGENPYSALSDVIRRQQNERIVEPLRVRLYDAASERTGLSGAELAERSDAARTWTRADNPVVLFRGEGPSVAVNTVQPQVIVGLEDHGRPGYLCVRKLADRVFASPGDVVTFTITLENTGGKPLTDVTVLDNLTPRLAFVAGSAESDLPGRVEVTPNGEGSDIVRFVLTEPLDAGRKGSVSFQTRVR